MADSTRDPPSFSSTARSLTPGVGPGHRAADRRRCTGHGDRQPAARRRLRRRLRGELHQPDRRAGSRRRPLLRRGDHHQRRPADQQCRRPCLRRRVRPRRRGDPRRNHWPVQGQRPDDRDAGVPVPNRPGPGDGHRAHHRPRQVPRVVAADLPERQSDVYGLSQRPIAAGALGEETSEVAWKDLPSWAAVGTADLAAGSDIVRSMAQRADATVTEVQGSHVIMMSQPDAVTDVILTAHSAVS